jgi:hypothetical protein
MPCPAQTFLPVWVLWGRDSSLPPAFQPACPGSRNRRGAQRDKDLVVQASTYCGTGPCSVQHRHSCLCSFTLAILKLIPLAKRTWRNWQTHQT